MDIREKILEEQASSHRPYDSNSSDSVSMYSIPSIIFLARSSSTAEEKSISLPDLSWEWWSEITVVISSFRMILFSLESLPTLFWTLTDSLSTVFVHFPSQTQQQL